MKSNWSFVDETKPCKNEGSMVPLLRLKMQPNDQTLNEYFGLVQKDLPTYSDVDAFGTPKIRGCDFLALGTQIPSLAQFPRNPYMEYGNPYGTLGIAQMSGAQYLSTSTRTGKKIFRSRHGGICPLGWVSGPNGLCLPENESQREGMFYSLPNASALYGFSNCTPQRCNGARQ
ncbi:hypothetical protein GMAR_ORF156 [Golden Marseillevirus]|uniref:hypothetical protein n=1 Tax=Golden Marseillevirus TaxID=1720526 RepID=UPI000877A90F|nr:hypothetical protein GMAR_ORF156 [Golden Marseillevirus]ALX27530.1 hypothetical protein GMAR_ORF156 [Golden Marseillevirus]